MALEKFDVLEEKVRQLTEKFSSLRTEKEGFARSIQEMGQQIEELQQKNRSLVLGVFGVGFRLDKVISNLEKVSLNM